MTPKMKKYREKSNIIDSHEKITKTNESQQSKFFKENYEPLIHRKGEKPNQIKPKKPDEIYNKKYFSTRN